MAVKRVLSLHAIAMSLDEILFTKRPTFNFFQLVKPVKLFARKIAMEKLFYCVMSVYRFLANPM